MKHFCIEKKLELAEILHKWKSLQCNPKTKHTFINAFLVKKTKKQSCKFVALTPWNNLSLHGNILLIYIAPFTLTWEHLGNLHWYIHPAFVTCTNITFSCTPEQVLQIVVKIAQTPTVSHGNSFFFGNFSRGTLFLLLSWRMEGIAGKYPQVPQPQVFL